MSRRSPGPETLERLPSILWKLMVLVMMLGFGVAIFEVTQTFNI